MQNLAQPTHPGFSGSTPAGDVVRMDSDECTAAAAAAAGETSDFKSAKPAEVWNQFNFGEEQKSVEILFKDYAIPSARIV